MSTDQKLVTRDGIKYVTQEIPHREFRQDDVGKVLTRQRKRWESSPELANDLAK